MTPGKSRGRPPKRRSTGSGRTKLTASNPELVNPEPVLLCQEVGPDNMLPDQEVGTNTTLPKEKNPVLQILIEI